MLALSSQFEDIVGRGRDGFGECFDGTRAGTRMRIRVFAASDADRYAPARELAHAVVYLTERGQVDQRIWLASPADGTSIEALAASSDAGLLPASQCADVALALLDAVIAAARAELSLGPLLPCNVFLDAARPGWVRVFPLRLIRWRSVHWLQHAPGQLMFVDRHTLRERPTMSSSLFSIAALALLLLRGPRALPGAGGRTAAELAVEAIEVQHPLAGHVERTGPFEALVSEVLSGSLATPEGFRARLLTLKASYDPVARAELLRTSGKLLEATALLHRALKDGERSPRVYVYKAELEQEQGHVTRAVQTLREARGHAPHCRIVLERLSELTSDPAEALDARRKALWLDPLDGTLWIAVAEAAAHAGDMATALEHLAVAQAIAITEPAARVLWTRIARFLLTHGPCEAALAIAERHTGPDVEHEVRVEALEITGRALYAQQRFEPAASALREALGVLASMSRQPSTVLLNELAFALTPLGATKEAIAMATWSLRLDPAQPQIVRFLTAVSS